jgi:2-C-methyl-D-erythritol 4-phosphate cytidylyltransferase
MTTGGEKAVLIVVAGGSGARFGGDKLMVPLRGKPVFVHTLERLAPAAKRTVLVVPAGREAEFERAAAKYLPGVDLAVTAGGASRSESVARGVEAAKLAPGELAAIHDAARPLAAPELLRELCRKAREVGGAVPGFPQTDAQKRTDANGLILDDLPRENVWNVGTPQVFRSELVLRACADGNSGCLDDAEAVRRIGGKVAVVPTDRPNTKLTVPADLKAIEEAL